MSSGEDKKKSSMNLNSMNSNIIAFSFYNSIYSVNFRDIVMCANENIIAKISKKSLVRLFQVLFLGFPYNHKFSSNQSMHMVLYSKAQHFSINAGVFLACMYAYLTLYYQFSLIMAL